MTSASPTEFSFSSKEIAEVDVLLEAGRDNRSFTYLDTKGLGVDLGDLVLVRLKGRPMHGLVVARRNSSSLKSTKNIGDQAKRAFTLLEIEALVQSVAVDPAWRDWLETVASDCYVTSFRMLKAALPPGWIGQAKYSEKDTKFLWWIEAQPLASGSVSLTGRQKEFLDFLKTSKKGGIWLKDIGSTGFYPGVVKALLEAKVVSREKRPFLVNETSFEVIEKDMKMLEVPKDLTNEQKKAIDLYSSIPRGSSMLLWGITGSGKTEVYLQLASKELSERRHCLILAPEIGLIPQLVDRFRKRFGSLVFEYHSGCTNRERVRTWKAVLKAKEPLVVVGTRSAVFMPLTPLGLIVIDEEHDISYKQQSPMPCYHARELALGRAKRVGAKVILGSATPSILTWKNLAPQGPLALARLTRRISSQPLPPVYVVDMRQELATGNRRLISRALMQKLSELPQRREQAVILVPRRGYSGFLSCRSCGEVVQCPHCDVALSVHLAQKSIYSLRCHWCGYRTHSESKCGACGSEAFKPFGAGTQRVMETLAKELEGLKLLRFDKDSTGGRDGHRRLLETFASGEADVLVGTQMLSKGMDLPRVTLAAVLAADGLLHRPDLQAGEQTLQLLMQLAGRAGRGDLPGKVFVQTYCPEHPVIEHLVDGRYEEFLREETSLRRDAGLVPFSRACMLRLNGDTAAATASAASILSEQIKPFCESGGWKLIGPAPAMVAKVAGRSRWQILLHGPESSPLPLPRGSKLWSGLPRGVTLAVDPDPIQL